MPVDRAVHDVGHDQKGYHGEQNGRHGSTALLIDFEEFLGKPSPNVKAPNTHKPW